MRGTIDLCGIRRGLVEVENDRADQIVHDRRDRDAVLEVAVLVQCLYEPGEVGHHRVVKPINLAVGTLDQLRQVHARGAIDGSQHEAADRERDTFARSVLELAAVVGDAASRRGLEPQSARSGRRTLQFACRSCSFISHFRAWAICLGVP